MKRDNLNEIRRLKTQIRDQKREIKEQRREIDFMIDCSYEDEYDHRKCMYRLATCLFVVSATLVAQYITSMF